MLLRLNIAHLIALTTALPLFVAPALGQIGGQTAQDGDFVVDDFEDLNLMSATLERDWLVSVIIPVPEGLDLEGKGLTLASGQSPAGAMQAEFPDDQAFIGQEDSSAFGDFGIPMPGVPGASTDPEAGGEPGDITSFHHLRFVHCYELSGGGAETEVTFNVVLECYPGNPDGTFPKLLWNYEPVEGTTFEETVLGLRNPDAVLDNPEGRTVEELLAQTRFLDFFFIATPVNSPARLDVRVDDVMLISDEPTSVGPWQLYQ